MSDITQLLQKWREGDREAENELFTLVFPMLLAAGIMLYLRWHAHRTAVLAGLPAATLA